jgi:DHA1 family bicyclomycin/chloramphenicol resistance-like MFS transporter
VLARAIVGDIYSDKKATSMFGYISIIMAIGPLLGPLVGGLTTEALGSIYIFNFLLILGLLILILLFFELEETNLTKSKSIFHQAECYPLLLKSQKFWIPTFVSSFSFSVFGVFFIGGPFVAANTFGLSPTWTGIFFGCPAIGFILGNIFVSKLINKFSTKQFLICGAVFLTFGPMLSFMLTELYFNPLAFFFPIILMTFGTGIIWPTSNTEIVKAVPSLAGSASGLSSALMVLISSFATGMTGVIIEDYNAILIVTIVLISIGIITSIFSFFIKTEKM